MVTVMEVMAMAPVGTGTAVVMGAMVTGTGTAVLPAPAPALRQDQVRLAALLEAVRVIIGTRRERTDLWMEVDGR